MAPGLAGDAPIGNDLQLTAAPADELLAYAVASIPPDAQGDVRVAVVLIRYGAEVKARHVPEISAGIAVQGR